MILIFVIGQVAEIRNVEKEHEQNKTHVTIIVQEINKNRSMYKVKWK